MDFDIVWKCHRIFFANTSIDLTREMKTLIVKNLRNVILNYEFYDHFYGDLSIVYLSSQDAPLENTPITLKLELRYKCFCTNFYKYSDISIPFIFCLQ